MSTSDTPPTDPTNGDSGGPQDPSDPTNPYGPPVPPPPPPAPDPTIDPAAPPAPPAPAAPAAPAYGQPPAAPYGQPPAAPYGQPPAYGQPAYGQPGQPGYPPQPGYAQPFPGAPVGPEQGSKGLAIGALICSIIGCLVITPFIAIVLAILALRQGKDGKNHGKGMAIIAIILSVVWLIVIALVVALAVVASNYSSIDDLNTGTCVTAKGLTDTGDSVSEIKTVSCSSSHDGEVLATHVLSGKEASGYGDTEANTLCNAAITAAGKADVLTAQVRYVGLTESASPKSGDKLVCVAFNADGSKLTKKLGS